MSALVDKGDDTTGASVGAGDGALAGLGTSIVEVRWLATGFPALLCFVHGDTAFNCVGEFGLVWAVKWFGFIGVTGRLTVMVAAALQERGGTNTQHASC